MSWPVKGTSVRIWYLPPHSPFPYQHEDWQTNKRTFQLTLKRAKKQYIKVWNHNSCARFLQWLPAPRGAGWRGKQTKGDPDTSAPASEKKEQMNKEVTVFATSTKTLPSARSGTKHRLFLLEISMTVSIRSSKNQFQYLIQQQPTTRWRLWLRVKILPSSSRQGHKATFFACQDTQPYLQVVSRLGPEAARSTDAKTSLSLDPPQPERGPQFFSLAETSARKGSTT